MTKNWKMIGLVGLAASALLMAGCAIPAQAGGPSAASGQNGAVVVNSISVSGYGEASGQPDVAHITVGVDVTDPDVGKAVTENNARVEAVRQAVLDAGIAAEDIQTVGFSVWPEDKYDPQSGMPSGERTYHVSNQLSIKVRDLSKAGSVIDVALDAGANTVHGLSFAVEDSDGLEAEARVNAIADARAKAAQIAEALGVTLGDAIMVTDGYAPSGPILMYPEMAAADGVGMGGGSAVPVSPGQLTVSQSISIVFAIGQ